MTKGKKKRRKARKRKSRVKLSSVTEGCHSFSPSLLSTISSLYRMFCKSFRFRSHHFHLIGRPHVRRTGEHYPCLPWSLSVLCAGVVDFFEYIQPEANFSQLFHCLQQKLANSRYIKKKNKVYESELSKKILQFSLFHILHIKIFSALEVFSSIHPDFLHFRILSRFVRCIPQPCILYFSILIISVSFPLFPLSFSCS